MYCYLAMNYQCLFQVISLIVIESIKHFMLWVFVQINKSFKYHNLCI